MYDFIPQSKIRIELPKDAKQDILNTIKSLLIENNGLRITKTDNVFEAQFVDDSDSLSVAHHMRRLPYATCERIGIEESFANPRNEHEQVAANFLGYQAKDAKTYLGEKDKEVVGHEEEERVMKDRGNKELPEDESPIEEGTIKENKIGPECDPCDGCGAIHCPKCGKDGGSNPNCSTCNGKGEIKCPTCHGKGEINSIKEDARPEYAVRIYVESGRKDVLAEYVIHTTDPKSVVPGRTINLHGTSRMIVKVAQPKNIQEGVGEYQGGSATVNVRMENKNGTLLFYPDTLKDRQLLHYMFPDLFLNKSWFNEPEYDEMMKKGVEFQTSGEVPEFYGFNKGGHGDTVEESIPFE